MAIGDQRPRQIAPQGRGDGDEIVDGPHMAGQDRQQDVVVAVHRLDLVIGLDPLARGRRAGL